MRKSDSGKHSKAVRNVLFTHACVRRIKLKRTALATMNQNELRVIVISSDEEDEVVEIMFDDEGREETSTSRKRAARAAQRRREREQNARERRREPAAQKPPSTSVPRPTTPEIVDLTMEDSSSQDPSQDHTPEPTFLHDITATGTTKRKGKQRKQ